MGPKPRCAPWIKAQITRATAATTVGLSIALLATTPALDLNAYRRAHKLPPLQYSSALAAAAQWHAENLARRNRLSRAPMAYDLTPICL